MSDLAIHVENISKRYRLGVAVANYRTLGESLAEAVRSPFSRRAEEKTGGPETLWALQDVSFDVKQGQVLGVIGRNGAGKSTLLKILARVTYPTRGRAELRGRIGSLLEVGTGFHPELTGRENIFLNGAILGMKRSETERRFDEIVEFAEISQFIDTPVKRYSSGMYLRLAFAVAAHLEPEILVVDEVLAVGDAEFQRKCLGKMSDVAEQGRTILFVSHNMSAVLRLTDESIVIEKGKIALRAPTAQAVDYYLSRGLALEGQRVWHDDEVPASAAPFRPLALRICNRKGQVVDTLRSVEDTAIEFEYELSSPITGLRVGVYLMSTRGEFIFTSFDTDEPEMFEMYGTRAAGRYISRCRIPPDLFNEGRYVIGVNASSFKVKRYFQDEQALTFNVDAAGAAGTQWPEPRQGAVRPRLDWNIEAVNV